MSDPAKYRAEGELEGMKKSDCLLLAESRLLALGVDPSEFERVRDEVEAIAKDAYDFAEASPEPDPATLYDYTWAPSS
jgi:pyruvate dehydrogenase E1 component alpha subunit